MSTPKTYVRAMTGSKPVDTIGTDDVLSILKPIWNTKTETAKRVQERIENILDYAATHSYRDQDHLPMFMAELRANGSLSALALQFLILTATRTSEILEARWEEIDLENRTWTIPATRMRAEREHRVPLSDAFLTVLEALPKVHGNPYLLAGRCRTWPCYN